VDHSASEFHREPLPAPSTVALHQALTTDRMPGQARELAFTPMGGAYNRVPVDATAFVHRGDKFLLEYTATSDPAQPAASRRAAYQWLSHVRELLDGYGTAARTRTSPTRSWPIRCARTTGKTCPGCAMSSVTTIPATFSVTSSRSL
jgi:hypothetical protein